MAKKIDCHMHSHYSDGGLPPAELMQKCLEQKINYAILTDHDTVDGAKEAELKAKELSIQFSIGVELSCAYDGQSFHILGFGIDCQNRTLLNKLNHLKKLRSKRAIEIVKKLEKRGWKVNRSVLNKTAGAITRIKIAEAVENRMAPANEFFGEWLGKDCLCFVKMERMAVKDAIKLIHQAGGIAVWAHPAKTLKKNPHLLPQTVKKLKSFGLDGLEVFYSEYNEEQTKTMYELALEHKLLMSAGSDFHWTGGLRKLGEYNLYGLKFNQKEIANRLISKE